MKLRKNALEALVIEKLVMIAVVIILFGLFYGASIYSIFNTNFRNAACRSCRDGKPPNITVGSVISMPCANNTVIYNSGNLTNPVLNFGIPSGCLGTIGANGSVILSVFDSPSNLTFIKDSPYATTNLGVFITANETISYIQVPGDPGPTGFAGPKGNTGIQGIQGPQGPTFPLILGIGRISTPGFTFIPLPIGATAVYYTIVGGGGGGGGGCGFALGGSGGGGGGSGRKRTGFEILAGVTSAYVYVGAGGSGGISYDIRTYPTNGNPGGLTILGLTPINQINASGGNPGTACSLSTNGGNGGDGGYGGGGGGTSGPCCAGFYGISENDGLYSNAYTGSSYGGGGGNGAGPNAGSGGLGTNYGYIWDAFNRPISMSGGGGGGGGPLINSGGNGGTFINSLSGSGGTGAIGSGGGGGGAAGNYAGADPRNQQNSDLITFGDTGGEGGSGFIEYLFV